MKQQLLAKVCYSMAIALSFQAIAPKPSYSQPAPGEKGFWCNTSMGIPITVYQNSRGGIEPWIEWASDHFSSSGYDAVTRCQVVSQRLETYRRNGQLKYITAGRMNGQNVICVANQVHGACEGLVYTLRPDQDPIKALYNLLAWRAGQVGMPSTNESGEIPYIDVRGKLENEPANGGNGSPFSPKSPGL